MAEAKARLGIPPGRLVIGAVGRLSGEKGFDLLIRAVDRLLAEGLDLELMIVGEGDRPARARGPRSPSSAAATVSTCSATGRTPWTSTRRWTSSP